MQWRCNRILWVFSQKFYDSNSRKDSGHPAYINIRSVPIHHGQIGETVLPQSKGSPTTGQYYQEKPDRLGATPQEKGQTLFDHSGDTSESDDLE